MSRLPAFSAHRHARGAAAAGLAVALSLSLVGCKDAEALAATPGGQALIASQPAVSRAHVPPPPAIVGVIGVPAEAGSAVDAGDLAKADAQLDATLANASACSADTECRAVAVGGRSCGGPSGYRAYSTKSVDPASVDALAQRQRELSAQAARASHQVSPCYMLANPGARCVQNKCVTGHPGTN